MTAHSALLAKIVSPEQGGFMTLEDIRAMATLDGKRQLLIRCNACRMVVSADSVEHVCDIINASEKDWVRDVGLLSTDPAHRPAPTLELPPAKPAPPRPKAQPKVETIYTRYQHDYDYGGDSYECFSDADPGL